MILMMFMLLIIIDELYA